MLRRGLQQKRSLPILIEDVTEERLAELKSIEDNGTLELSHISLQAVPGKKVKIPVPLTCVTWTGFSDNADRVFPSLQKIFSSLWIQLCDCINPARCILCCDIQYKTLQCSLLPKL